MFSKPLIYIASPYSINGTINKDAKEKQLEGRWDRVTEFLGYCLETFGHQYVFFSPITHSHPASKYMLIHYNTYEFWVEEQDKYFVEAASEVWVLMDEDWNQSRGVKAEIEMATKAGKTVRYFDPGTFAEIGVDRE